MKPLSTVVVGFGRAARAFHLPILTDLVEQGLATGSVSVVDPLMASRKGLLPTGAVAHTRIPMPETAGDAVVHVCTPPDTHAGIVREAHALGYRNFIVEKPMATSLSDAEDMVVLAEQEGAEILVVANWSVSSVAASLQKRLRQRGTSSVSELHFAQHKPRFARTASDAGHLSAFDVEIPHLVAAALFLVGDSLEVIHARCEDLVLGGVSYPDMARAEIALRSQRHGLRMRLSSDLTVPHRERSVHIEWTDGTSTVGFFPCDSSDLYGQIFETDADGRCTEREIVYDDTVSKFFRAAYSYFSEGGLKPTSDVYFGNAITQLIFTAKEIHALTQHHPATHLEPPHARPFYPAQTSGHWWASGQQSQ
ncbi:Gfo/Idh/MocA family oxidoreductase [Streptomyces collinus]|uniref:Gfo/Idh/MocA family oxidoreductase n=1 Tax=Streptomyces collinus TaxID=42684 RepID=UPI0036BA530C